MRRRELALSGRTASGVMRPLVAQSWKRCLAAGMARENMPLAPVPMQASQLDEYRSSHPLMRMLPLVRDLLGDVVREAGCVFAIVDAAGELLWVEGHPKTRGSAEQIHFVEGADWSERTAGTNAPGTSLALGRPVQIIGGEHFNGAVRRWSCAAAPIRDPDTGRLLGVLDLTGGPPAGSPPMLALVRATARSIESELARRLAVSDLAAFQAHSELPSSPGGAAFVSPGGRILAASPGLGLTRLLGLSDSGEGPGQLPDGRRLIIEPVGTSGYMVARFVESAGQVHPASCVRLSALGRDNAVLDVDGRALSLGPRHSEIVVLLARATDGLTTGLLAAGLSPDTLNATSIRVEMSRLRDRLGDDLLASRPYLLRRQVRSDVDVVSDLIREGRVRDALNSYPGPLLPHSQAPGVAQLRQTLHRQLQQAVVASYSARLIERWLETPWGATDLSGWEALARLLPEGTPRRLEASARADTIRESLGSENPF